MAIKAVLFDAGGVLVTPPIAKHQDLVPHLDVDEVRRRFYATYTRTAMSTEAMLPDFWTSYGEDLGLEPNIFAALSYEDEMLRWNSATDAAREVLRTVRDAGMKVAVVSNAGGNVQDLLEEAGVCHLGTTGGGVEIDAIFDSGDLARYPDESLSRKPHPLMIQDALNLFGIEANEALFVGDALWSDGMAAHNANVSFIHMDPFEACTDTEFPVRSITLRTADHRHVKSMKEVLLLLDE